MTSSAGPDISPRSTHICVIDDNGALLAEGKADSEVADIITFLDKLDVEITEVGLDAGTLTRYLTSGLQFAGYEEACMEARQVKWALSAMRNKTDENDARGIARLRRSGRSEPVPTAWRSLTRVRMPSKKYYKLQELDFNARLEKRTLSRDRNLKIAMAVARSERLAVTQRLVAGLREKTVIVR